MSTSLATDSNAASQNSDLEAPLRIACPASKPTESFTKFLKLPKELQLNILDLVLPQPCYFYVKADLTTVFEPEKGRIVYTIYRVISQDDPQHAEQTRRSTRTLRHLDILAINWHFRNWYIDHNRYALNLRGHGQLYISTTDVVYIQNLHILLADPHFELPMRNEPWRSDLKEINVPLCGFANDEVIAHLNSIEGGLRWADIDHPLVALLRIFSSAERVVVAFDDFVSGLKGALNCLTEDAFDRCLKRAHRRESLECGRVAAALDRLSRLRGGRISVPKIVCFLNLWDKRGYVEGNSDEPSSCGAIVTDASMTKGLAEPTS